MLKQYSLKSLTCPGLRSEGIYRVSPVKSVLISLRLALDEGKTGVMLCHVMSCDVTITDPAQVDILDPNWDQNAFASALKLFLRELPTPVFTYQLYEHFVSAGSEL